MLFRILLIIAASAFFLRIFGQYRTKKVSFSWLSVCTLFSAAVVVVVLNPGITDFLANIAGVGRGADLVVYSSLVILFIATLSHTIALEKSREELTELVRKLAIDNAKEPEPKK